LFKNLLLYQFVVRNQWFSLHIFGNRLNYWRTTGWSFIFTCG